MARADRGLRGGGLRRRRGGDRGRVRHRQDPVGRGVPAHKRRGRRAGDHRSRAPWREGTGLRGARPAPARQRSRLRRDQGRFPTTAAQRLPGSCPSWVRHPPPAWPSLVPANGSSTPPVRLWRWRAAIAPRRSCSWTTSTPPIPRRSTLSPTSDTGWPVAGCCCSPHTARTSPTPSDPARGLPISVAG